MGLLDGGPYKSYAAMGLDPKEMQRKAIFNTIAQLGIGLLSGKNWGQGIGQGLLSAQQASQQTQEDAMRQAQFGLQQQQAQTEAEKAKRAQEAETAKQKAIDDYIASQPPEKQPALRSAAAVGALDNIIGDQFKPFTPNVENITRGSQAESGYFDRDGKWVSMGSGPRWAPQQPPAPPADPETIRMMRAAGIDPASPQGQEIIRQKLTGADRPSNKEAQYAEWLNSPDPRLKQAAEKYFQSIGQAGGTAQTWSGEQVDQKSGRRYIVSSRGDRKWLDPADQVVTDALGNIAIVNKTTNQITPLNLAGEAPNAGQAFAQAPTPLIKDAAGATGALSNIQAGISETLGQIPVIGESFTAPETMASRQRVELFAQTAKEALVNNPRFPVEEQKLVATMLPDSGEWFRSQSTAESKVVQLHDFLIQNRAAKVNSLQNSPLSKEGRQTLTDQIASIDRVLQLMGPLSSDSGASDASAELDALLNKPSDQWTPEDFKRAEELGR